MLKISQEHTDIIVKGHVTVSMVFVIVTADIVGATRASWENDVINRVR